MNLKRQAENWIQNEIKIDQEYMNKVQKAFDEAIKNINNQINAFYSAFAGKNNISIEDAKKLADEMDVVEFAEKAKEYVANKDFSKQANDELALYNLKMKISRLELLKAQIALENAKLQDEIADIQSEYYEQQSGIIGNEINMPALEYLNTMNNLSKFSPQIWKDIPKLNADVEKLLNRSLVLGTHPAKLASELKKKYGTTAYQAKRLMLTEKAFLQSRQALESYKAHGDKYYSIVGEPDACDECRYFIGRKFDLDDFEAGVTASPFHPNCRCAVIPIHDDEAWKFFKEE